MSEQEVRALIDAATELGRERPIANPTTSEVVDMAAGQSGVPISTTAWLTSAERAAIQAAYDGAAA